MKALFSSFFLLCTCWVFAQQHTISGSITDAKTGETLIGAAIRIDSTTNGTVSNVYGFYSLQLKEGSHTLTISFVGFEDKTINVKTNENQKIDIELAQGNIQLSEVKITGRKADQNVSSMQMSKVQMKMSTIRSIPALFGEVDVIKAIQLLPGVATAGEGSSGFFVRGGNSDQNLVLIDEATVYNASHLLGFFSVFNPDAVKDVQLYKGGIPARYGGRLASVLDVRLTEGNMKEFEGSAGIGLIASRVTLQAPIIKDKWSVLGSLRRTYLDLFLKASSKEDLRQSKLYFYDGNLKTNVILGDKDRLFLSGYFGRDVFGQGANAKFSWGNATGSARWNHIYNGKLFSNVTFLYSNYDYGLEFNSPPNSFKWDSNIKDITLKADYSYFSEKVGTWRFGGAVTLHTINPGEIKVAVSGEEFKAILYQKKALETGLYVSNEFQIADKLSALVGTRFSNFNSIGLDTTFTYNDNFEANDTIAHAKNEFYNTYNGLEPRLGLKYEINSRSSVKASYNRMYQYLQLASNSNAASPLDVWFPASPNIKPQRADQVALGYFRNFFDNQYEFSTEVFYKDMQNAIDFKNQATLLLNQQLEGEIRTGRAAAYGLELFLRKNEGRFNGFVSATFSAVNKRIDVDEVLPGEEFYPAKYSKPFDFAVVGTYDITPRIEVGATFVYSSGLAVTLPTGKYFYKGQVIPIYTERNAGRIPAYHRADVGITFKNRPEKKFERSLVISIYNIYNRHNVFSILFQPEENDPNQLYAEKVYLFPILPSVTYNINF